MRNMSENKKTVIRSNKEKQKNWHVRVSLIMKNKIKTNKIPNYESKCIENHQISNIPSVLPWESSVCNKLKPKNWGEMCLLLLYIWLHLRQKAKTQSWPTQPMRNFIGKGNRKQLSNTSRLLTFIFRETGRGIANLKPTILEKKLFC